MTNLCHAGIRVEDAVGRSLLARLDGTRDRAALIDELRTVVADVDELPKALDTALASSPGSAC